MAIVLLAASRGIATADFIPASGLAPASQHQLILVTSVDLGTAYTTDSYWIYDTNAGNGNRLPLDALSTPITVVGADISLDNVSNDIIITGGTGTLGATVGNSALSGTDNLDFALAAAVQSGSAALGAVTPGTGSLAPGTSQSCTVSATSTSLGVNTISFTASDANASNSPQTTNATLTVLDHASASAAIVSGNNFVSHVGATALAATITLSNAPGTRSDLQVNAAPTLAGGTLGAAPAIPFFVSSGTSQNYTVTFSTPTAGSYSNALSFTQIGDNQALSGAAPLGSSSAAICGSVFSGTATWNSSSGSTWGAGASPNWSDANGVHAAPGTFAGFTKTDSAIFSGSGTVTAIDLTGANPSLNTLNLSNSNYTLLNGSLTLNGSNGMANVTVDSGTQTINTPVTLAGNSNCAVNGGALLSISAINGPGALTKIGAGMLTLTGSNSCGGNTTVDGGTLQVPCGSLNSPTQYVGYSATGALLQSGGVNTITGTGGLYLGTAAGASGTYNLIGGSLSCGSYEYVGLAGSSTFTQSGGTNSITYVEGAVLVGSNGAYNLSGNGLLSTFYEGIANTCKRRKLRTVGLAPIPFTTVCLRRQHDGRNGLVCVSPAAWRHARGDLRVRKQQRQRQL